jgi:hypothetical protein
MNLEENLAKLVETTTFTKECTIGELPITLKVLNFSEESKMSKMLDELSDGEDYSVLGDWKKYVISSAIHKIDGEPIPETIMKGEEKIAKSLYIKDFLDGAPSKIIDTLFDIYTDLKEESEKDIDEHVIYNWFKDPKERKAEDAKKIKEMTTEINNAPVPEDSVDDIPVPEEATEEVSEEHIDLKKID